MAGLNPRAYADILKMREAYRFDIGAFLMRLFSYTTTIGTIGMLTMAGASALQASSVASLIAVCMFFVAPRVSKLIDERGQSAVVPAATLIAMAGFGLMIANTHIGGPFWVNYLAAPLASFLPNAQALVRTRWTYLIATKRADGGAPPLATAYAYEGILEDVAFMVGPASVLAICAAVTPVAGVLAGALLYCLGAALLVSSKRTEPVAGWRSPSSSAQGCDSATDSAAEGAASSPALAKKASVLRSSPVVRVLFCVMVLFGAIYGAFDTAAISYCESIGFAQLASIAFASESVFSVTMSFVFGMIGLNFALRRQFVAFSMLFGCLYALFFLVDSPTSLLVITCVSALAYAPYYITANLTCERAVDSANLTEAISWLASGQSIGMVIGPVSSGAIIDVFGPLAGFKLTALFAVGMVVLALCCTPVLLRHL